MLKKKRCKEREVKTLGSVEEGVKRGIYSSRKKDRKKKERKRKKVKEKGRKENQKNMKRAGKCLPW